MILVLAIKVTIQDVNVNKVSKDVRAGRKAVSCQSNPWVLESDSLCGFERIF